MMKKKTSYQEGGVGRLDEQGAQVVVVERPQCQSRQRAHDASQQRFDVERRLRARSITHKRQDANK